MLLPILTYHSIDESGSPVSVSPEMLRRHLARLSAAGYTVYPLPEALAQLEHPSIDSRRIAAMCFDDGYATVHTIALPLLASYGWHATVFPVCDYIGRDNAWPGQPAFVPRARLLSWTQLAELAGLGWSIGAHTRTHPNLTRLDDRALAGEVRDGKTLLEDRLGLALGAFAYPYGCHDRRVRAQARAVYTAACTTQMGIASEHSDRSALERIDMWYFSRGAQQSLLASPFMRPYVVLRQAARRARELTALGMSTSP